MSISIRYRHDVFSLARERPACSQHGILHTFDFCTRYGVAARHFFDVQPGRARVRERFATMQTARQQFDARVARDDQPQCRPGRALAIARTTLGWLWRAGGRGCNHPRLSGWAATVALQLKAPIMAGADGREFMGRTSLVSCQGSAHSFCFRQANTLRSQTIETGHDQDSPSPCLPPV